MKNIIELVAGILGFACFLALIISAGVGTGYFLKVIGLA